MDKALKSVENLRTLFQTISAILTFLVAMSLYPDVLKRAQNELDSVIGRDRLPTFEDRLRLPFIDAIYKEVMRWRPVTPVGECPHDCSHKIAEKHPAGLVLTDSTPTCA
jgi:hypothetical protein